MNTKSTQILPDDVADAEAIYTSPSQLAELRPHQKLLVDTQVCRSVPVSQIKEHPLVTDVLSDLQLLRLWSVPDQFFGDQSYQLLGEHAPLRVMQSGTEYECFGGFLLLSAAKRVRIPGTTNMSCIVHSCPNEAYMRNLIMAETILEPIWHRLDRVELRRLTLAILRLQENANFASVFVARSKVAIARLLKRSVSSLRRKK